MSTTSVCQICDEKMNKSTRVAIHCEFCNFEACRSCNQRYVINESTVKCMNRQCGREWTRKFIRKSFTMKFINGDLKKHREQILFDKERALLPLTQRIIERDRKIDQLSAELRTVIERSAIDHLTQEENDELERLQREIDALFDEMKKPEKKAVFIRGCPAEECRGFLNNEWQCGICEKQCCPDCHIILCDTTTKHECNADDLATAQLLLKDTKPCPKCATGIFKIDGCDQMWCTQCHTAFSWRTGEIENKIHNPHYYEWLRRNGGVPRNPDDIQCGGEQLTPYLVTKIRLRIQENHPELFPIFEKCENIVRTMIHLEHHIPRPENYEHRNGMMRFDYLLNRITETKMKKQLELNERNNNKKQEFYDIFLLIKTAITDIMLRISRDLRQKTSNNTPEILSEIEPLLEYANECLDEISYTYSCTKMKYVFSERGGIILYKGNKPIYSTTI
jgi:hypothetical protein